MKYPIICCWKNAIDAWFSLCTPVLKKQLRNRCKHPLTLTVTNSTYLRKILTCLSASLASHIAVTWSTGDATWFHTLPTQCICTVSRDKCSRINELSNLNHSRHEIQSMLGGSKQGGSSRNIIPSLRYAMDTNVHYNSTEYKLWHWQLMQQMQRDEVPFDSRLQLTT